MSHWEEETKKGKVQPSLALGFVLVLIFGLVLGLILPVCCEREYRKPLVLRCSPATSFSYWDTKCQESH